MTSVELSQRLEQLCQQVEDTLALSEGASMPLPEQMASYLLGYLHGIKAVEPSFIDQTLYDRLINTLGKQAKLSKELEHLLLSP